jgi:hypothetical protein
MKRLLVLSLVVLAGCASGCGKAKTETVSGEGSGGFAPASYEKPVATFLITDAYSRNKDGTFFYFNRDGTKIKADANPKYITTGELLAEWNKNKLQVKDKYQGKRVRLVGSPHSMGDEHKDGIAMWFGLNIDNGAQVLCQFANRDKLGEVTFNGFQSPKRIAVEATWGADTEPTGKFLNCTITNQDVKDLKTIPD